jgi:hypothetical protein
MSVVAGEYSAIVVSWFNSLTRLQAISVAGLIGVWFAGTAN